MPDISGGSDTATIGGGVVTNIPSSDGDWSNNSIVILSNDAQWVQTSGIEWIRIAGDKSRKKGVLILNDTSKFSAGTSSTVALGVQFSATIGDRMAVQIANKQLFETNN